MNPRTNHIINIAILALTFIFAFIHTACREWVGDDICYAAVFGTEDTGHVELIANVSDIVRSQWSHYLYDNGRMPVHFIVQFFVGVAGKTCFAVCNATVFVLVVLLICRFITGRLSLNHPWVVLIVAICMFSLFPTASEVRIGPWFGAAMAVNYLWTSAAFLLFLIVISSRRHFSPRQTACVIVLSFLLGWSNEAFSIPLLGASIVWWHRLSGRQKMLTCFLALGASLLVIAPGTVHRAMAHGGGKSLKDMAVTLLDCYAGVKIFWILLAVTIGCLLLRRRKTADFIHENCFLATLLGVEVLFSLFAHTEAHSLTCIELTSLLLLGRAAYSVLPQKRYPAMLLAVLLLFVSFQSAIAFENHKAREQYNVAVRRYLSSSNGFTYIEKPHTLPLVGKYIDNYFHPVTPQSYFATRFAALYGRPGVLPIILSKTDYQIIRDGQRPETAGSAHAVEGEDWFIVPYDGNDAEYMAYFDDDSFMADFSPLRKAVYKYLLRSQKAPKKLEAEHIHTDYGEYILLRKLLSRPTRIEVIGELE